MQLRQTDAITRTVLSALAILRARPPARGDDGMREALISPCNWDGRPSRRGADAIVTLYYADN